MTKQKRQITEFDIFFLSYDEPNAEAHWADLLDKAPWAKRVHGVKGFDAAHRECARQSETEWFVTVDADNIVMMEFFDVTVELDPINDINRCFSWNARNMFNGLTYGNGGLKLWSRKFAANMKSHELSDDKNAVDFCWENDYQQVYQTYSEVWNNSSAYQAFRVGFREGVKLALDRGQRVEPQLMKTQLHPVNLRNLKVWSTVGADVNYGLWAIYGTRLGWLTVCDTKWDMTCIRDYDWFDNFWKTQILPITYGIISTSNNVEAEVLPLIETNIRRLGSELLAKTKINIPFLDSSSSEFFRETFRYRND